MSQDEVVTIAKAKRRIEAVLETNDGFLENARTNAVPRDIPTKLEFGSDDVFVDVFGYRILSKPRVVRVGDDFYMEYRFLVRFEDEEHEVTRFYVGAGGLVYEDLESESKMCDYNNEYIASLICSRVALGLLKSPVFDVAEKG
ncbi:hypothetical protein [Billgrantia sp. C5P2]|uniref:hypothetical protein n=1 Tax=Billgrantia sp. C5P2 TaxID=3436239 RepID=UPI003DA454D6